MIAFGRDALTQHHLRPGIDAEQLSLVLPGVGALLEHFYAARQGRWNEHAPAVTPERAVVPFDRVIVQYQKITYRLELSQHFLVVLIDEGLHDPVEGKQAHQARDPRHDEMDAGRFEWLEKSTREAQRHDVLVPGFQAPAGAELDHPRLGQGPALHFREQLLRGLLIGHVAAAIDESVADAMLQRNAPAPTRLMRNRAG